MAFKTLRFSEFRLIFVGTSSSRSSASGSVVPVSVVIERPDYRSFLVLLQSHIERNRREGRELLGDRTKRTRCRGGYVVTVSLPFT